MTQAQEHAPTAPALRRRFTLTPRAQNALFWLLLVALLAGLVCFEAPALGKTYWEYDEGINVIKAQLVQEGYWPHRDIWSDQPPLFTLMLVVVFKIFGSSLLVGRAFLLFWAVVLVAGTAWVTAHVAGRWAALGAAALLSVSPMLLELGRTVLVGLPSVAFGVLALGCLLEARRDARLLWPVLAGLCFGLGMLTKPLIAPYYAPLLVLLCWPTGQWHSRPRRVPWGRLVAFHAAPALLLVAAALLFGPDTFFGQVVGTFTDAREAYGFSLIENLTTIYASFGNGYYPGLIVAALLGVVLLARRRSPEFAWTAVWLVTAGAAVVLHTPQRWHEHLLLMPAFCALAASAPVSLRALSRGKARKMWTIAVAAAVVLCAAGLPTTFAVAYKAWWRPPKIGSKAAETQLALNLIRDYVDTPGTLIITDDPMLAFETGNTVPPQLAVPSLRRIKSGDSITSQELIALCEQEQVGAVLFWEQRLERLTDFYEWTRTHMALRARLFRRWFFVPVQLDWPQEACSADGLCLMGSSADTLAVKSGRSLDLTLYWRAKSDLHHRYTMFVHLVDDEGHSWGQLDEVPFVQTDEWLAGDIIMLPVTVPLDDGAPVGPLLLSVGWYDLEGNRVAFYDGNGDPLPGKQIALTPRPVVREQNMPAVPAPTVATDATLGELARLQGYDLEQTTDGAGRKLHLTLHWEALGETLTSYKVFVHVTGEAEAIIGQSDQEPSSGIWPTTGWLAGDVIADHHEITLPVEARGPLQVYVGMYDPATGERLRVTVAGEVRPDGRVPLVTLPE